MESHEEPVTAPAAPISDAKVQPQFEMANSVVLPHSPFTIEEHRKRRNPRSLLSNVSVAGVHRLSGTTVKTKCVWATAIAVCTGLCFNQITLRVKEFLQCPVSLDVKISRSQTVTFPSITLCSSNLHMALNGLINGKLNEEFNLDVDELWENGTRNLGKIDVKAPCLASVQDIGDCDNIDEYINLEMQPLEYVNTLWGKCVILTPKSKIEYRGPYTLMSVTLPEINKTNYVHYFRFYLHSQNSGQYLQHDAFFLADSVHIKHKTEVRLGIKEFYFLNTPKNPCIPELDTLQKRNRCINNKLEKALECRIPILNSTKLPNCTSLAAIRRAYLQAFKVYSDLSTSDCEYERKCHDIVISVTVHDGTSSCENVSETQLILYYADNLHETLHERKSYCFSALLSDIGGSLGFYLGVCVLTVLEIIEGLLAQVYIKFTRRT